MEKITSKTNPLMVHVRKLLSSRPYREKHRSYVGDGMKLLLEAVQWGADLQTVIYTAGTELPLLPDGVRIVEVSPELMKSISPMEAPQGALFIAQQKTRELSLSGSRYLLLEGVQDPGNIGTVIRTADAFEADGLILLPGCSDPYNHKTVRATMGAIFRLPIYQTTLAEVLPLLKEANLPLFGAALLEDTIDAREANLTRGAMLIGSEGKGLSREALLACDQTIKIPMGDMCESLNAAIAASVLLWEGYRKK